MSTKRSRTAQAAKARLVLRVPRARPELLDCMVQLVQRVCKVTRELRDPLESLELKVRLVPRAQMATLAIKEPSALKAKLALLAHSATRASKVSLDPLDPTEDLAWSDLSAHRAQSAHEVQLARMVDLVPPVVKVLQASRAFKVSRAPLATTVVQESLALTVAPERSATWVRWVSPAPTARPALTVKMVLMVIRAVLDLADQRAKAVQPDLSAKLALKVQQDLKEESDLLVLLAP